MAAGGKAREDGNRDRNLEGQPTGGEWREGGNAEAVRHDAARGNPETLEAWNAKEKEPGRSAER
jgi:hypothetical protein